MEKNIRIDFHTHILPEMDDGCADVEMSLKQLKMAAEHKIDIVIATSHFYPYVESMDSFLRRREEAWMKLQAVRDNEKPVVRLGAEVLICNGMERMDGIERLCVEGSNVLLAEMPFVYPWEPKLIETVERLRTEKALEVILAHGERYQRKEIQQLLERGFQVQLNVASSSKRIPSSFIKTCMKQQCIAALGSDLHGRCNNYKQFTKSMNRWGEEAQWIMQKTLKLLEGKEQFREKNKE